MQTLRAMFQQDRDLRTKMKIHRSLMKLVAKKNRVRVEQLSRLISIGLLLQEMIIKSVIILTQ